jgi:hypothetical protein
MKSDKSLMIPPIRYRARASATSSNISSFISKNSDNANDEMNLSQMFENGFDRYSIEDPNEIRNIDEKTDKPLPMLFRASRVKASMITN